MHDDPDSTIHVTSIGFYWGQSKSKDTESCKYYLFKINNKNSQIKCNFFTKGFQILASFILETVVSLVMKRGLAAEEFRNGINYTKTLPH